MKTKLLFSLLLIALITCDDQAVVERGCQNNNPHITRVSMNPDPNVHTNLTSSVHGGATFYIHGSHFDTISDKHTNKIWIGHLDCPVDTYWSSNEMLACHLPDKFHDIFYNLKVSIEACGKKAFCNNGDCTVNLETRYTPLLTTVLPQAAFAGDNLWLRGIWRTYNYSDLKEVRISGFNCEIADEKYEQTRNLDYWHTRNIACKTSKQLNNGNHNVSVTSQKGTGFNHPLRASQGFQVGHSTDVYNLRIHPKIYELSSNKGYLNGQQLIIKGQGFGKDKNKVRVKLEDKNCTVTEVKIHKYTVPNPDNEEEEIEYEEEHIYCDLELVEDPKLDENKNSRFNNKLFKGGAGFRRQMFDGWNRNFHLMLDETFKINNKDPTVRFDDIILSLENDLSYDHYVQRMYGVFRTDEAGEYEFRIAGDDQSRLYISNQPIDYSKSIYDGILDTENGGTGLNTVCNINGWTYFREWTREASQKGKMQLEADSDYYMLLFQTEGGGGDNISAGMTVPNSITGQINTTPNVQQIKINHEPIREKLRVDQLNTLDGTFRLLWQERNTQTGKYNYYKETREIKPNESEENFAKYVRWAIGVTAKVTRNMLDASGNVTTDDKQFAGYRWEIEYQSYFTRRLMPIIHENKLTGANSQLTLTRLQEQSNHINGRFKLKYGENTTNWINWNHSWSTITSRLQDISADLLSGISGYQEGSVYDGRTWYVVFESVTGNATPLEIVNMEIAGGNSDKPPTMSVNAKFEEATDNLVHLPIPSEFLRTLNSKPQIVVEVQEDKEENPNWWMAGCAKDLCNYEFYPVESSPAVESWEFSTVPGKENELSIVIKEGYADMDGFEDMSKIEKMRVRFGKADCEISDITLPKITCLLEKNTDGTLKLEVGNYKPMVHLKNHGYFLHSDSVQTLDVDLVYTSVSHAKGSLGGGLSLTINGRGFAINNDYGNTNTVTINDMPCEITDFSNIHIVCTTPEVKDTAHDATLKITTNGFTVSTQDFSYDEAITPKISSLTPNDSSPVLKADLAINGTQFDTDENLFKVWLIPTEDADGKTSGKEYECNAFEATTTKVTCRLSGGASGHYLIKIHKKGVGFSIPENDGDNLFKYQFIVTDIQPRSGSIEGGTLLTITGDNFSTVLLENQVVIGNYGIDYCLIKTATKTQLTCVIEKPNTHIDGVALPDDIKYAARPVWVLGRAQEIAVCPEDVCKFTFTLDKTPTVTKVEPREAVKGQTIKLEGTGFTTDLNQIKIKLGDVEVSPVSATTTEIKFEMPDMESSAHVPHVVIGLNGKAQYPEPYDLFNKLIFTTVNNTVITDEENPVYPLVSRYGQIISLQGNGFISGPEALSVKVNGKWCSILSITPSELKCDLPSFGSSNRDYNVELYHKVNGKNVRVECNTCKLRTLGNNPVVSKSSTDNQYPTPDTSDLTDVTVKFEGNNLISRPNGDEDPIQYNRENADAHWIPTEDKYNDIKIKGEVLFLSGEVKASFANMMAGDYYLKYRVDEVGYATNASNIKIENLKPQITKLDQIDSSFSGGALLNIEGQGFPKQELKHVAEVSVCGLPCEITSSQFDKITCRTPVLNHPVVHDNYSIGKPTVLRNASPYNDRNWVNNKKSFDGDINTYYDSGRNGTCYTGLDFGEGRFVDVSKIRVFPRIRENRNNLYYGRLECIRNGTVSASIEIGNTLIENWNEYRIEKENKFHCRQVRFWRTNGRCRIAEIEVTGILYADIDNFPDIEKLNNDGYKCDVSVKVMGVDSGTEQKEKVHYQKSKTPEVYTIEPRLGTTVGGTKITISGSNFATDSVVTIDGINCPIHSDSVFPDKIVCTTGDKPEFSPSSFSITSSTVGDANVKDNLFLYVDRWSDKKTWGGESPPREGDSVHIPKGQVLLVDESTPKLYAVIVEGTMIFSDEKDIDFHAWFIVNREGRIEAGMPDKRYQHKLTITMYGNRYSKMLPAFGNKGIFTHNGTIDLHGQERNHTWTLLKSTAQAGTKTIVVRDPVDWKKGEEIVIAPTSRSKAQSETRFIESVQNNAEGGKIITLDKELTHGHFVGVISPNDPQNQDQPLEIAAEVGLLTRNITIRGDESTNITEHGVHVLARGTEGVVRARYSYIELFLAGQKFQLGRYPIHFHMIGHVHDMYVIGCAVHRTFNRGTTIHGVHYLTLKWNVYYHTMGHTIFFEDGIESNNLVENNLVIHVRPAPSLLASDKKPSGIWMARPSNFIRKNHLVGCDGNGVWFELVGSPTGPSSALGAGICSSKDHLVQYDENVHHSNAIGIRIYPFYAPLTNPCGGISNFKKWKPYDDNKGMPAVYNKNIFWMNNLGNLNKSIGAIQHKDATFISNGTAQTLSSAKSARDRHARTEGGFMIGSSDVARFHGITGSGKAFGFGKGSGYVIKDTRFYDFNGSSLFSFCGECGSELKRVPGGVRQSFENVRFERTTSKIINFRDALYDKDIIRDFTGDVIRHFYKDEMDEDTKLRFEQLFPNQVIARTFAQENGEGDTEEEENQEPAAPKTMAEIMEDQQADTAQGGWITPWFPHLDIPECMRIKAGNSCNQDCAICTIKTSILMTKYQVLDNAHMMYGQDMKLYNLNSPHVTARGIFKKNWVFKDDQWKDTFSETKFRNCQLSIGWRGWASVLATGYHYNHHFGWGVEWKKMTATNDYYWGLYGIERDTYYRWNHTEPRELYDGWFTGLATPKDDTWVNNQTKTSLITRDSLADKAKEKEDADQALLDAGKNPNEERGEEEDPNADDYKNVFEDKHSIGDYYHDYVDKIVGWKFNSKRRGTVISEAIYCRDHCPEDDVPNEEVEESRRRDWNNKEDWKINEEDTDYDIPKDNETRIIEQGWNMFLNVKTAKLNHLIVKGRLTFDPDVDDLELHTYILEIQDGGEVFIGSEDARHTRNATIFLYGNKNSDYVVISPGIAPVNKSIINKGKLHLYGLPPSITWSRLKAEASVDAEHINLIHDNSQTGWKANDMLVIASSTTQVEEYEYVEIKEIVANSNEVKLKSKLKYYHYGAAEQLDTAHGKIDMRAEVGHLTRNIKIKSVDGDYWGCTILTPNIVYKNNRVVQGNLKFDGVEIKDCGQRDTKKGAIDMNFVKSDPGSNFVKNSSFHEGQGWAVNLYATRGFDFTNNVVYKPRKYAFFMQDSEDVNVQNNLLVGIKKRENYDNDEYWDLYIGFYYNDTTSLANRRVTFKHNSVSSMYWFGYAVPGYECTENDSNPASMHFYNNTAHSNKGGWFPTKIKNQECNRFANFKGYKNSEQGFAQRVDIRQVEAKNMILADNTNAFAMNGAPGTGRNLPYAKLSDSTIIGKALGIPRLYEADTECETSGFYSALFNGSPYDFYFEKTRMPLHNSTSVAFSWGGKQDLQDVVFENFEKNEACPKVSYALRMNNFYQDNTNAIFVRRVTLKNVSDENKFYFANPKKHPNTMAYCGMNLCTGNNNTPFYDMDGSILGKEMHYFGNNRGAGQDGDCTYFAEWNGHACNPVYAQLDIKVPADDRGLRFQPVILSIDDYDKDISDGLKFRHETDSPSHIINLVKLEKMTNITFSQSLPSGVRYQLMAPYENNYAMFKVYSENPATMAVFVNNSKNPKKPVVLKVDEELDLTKRTNQCGYNFYDAPNRIMYFLLHSKNCWVTIKLKNAIQLSTKLNIDPDTFFESGFVTTFLDRMAALLEISVDRIRIVGVRRGNSSSGRVSGHRILQALTETPTRAYKEGDTTQVDVVIEQEEEVTETRKDKKKTEEELMGFKEKFEQAVEQGTADLGVDVLEVQADLAIDNVEYVPPEDQNTEDNNTNEDTTKDNNNNDQVEITPKSKTTLYIILGVSIPIALIIIAVVVYCICKKKKGSTSKQTYQAPSMDATRTHGSIRDHNPAPYKVNNMNALAKHGNFARAQKIELNPTGKLDSYIRRK